MQNPEKKCAEIGKTRILSRKLQSLNLSKKTTSWKV